MDIQAVGQGFSATEVQFSAVTDKGKAVMAKLGGFACIGFTVPKSRADMAIDAIKAQGAIIGWA